MPSVLPRFRNWKVLLPTVFLTAAVAVVLVFLLGIGVGPCNDSDRFDGPDAGLGANFEAETNTVTVRHTWGDPLPDDVVIDLYLVVEDGETGAVSRYALANSSERYPIESDDTFRVENVTAGGHSVTEGDSIKVYYYGYEKKLPSYCLSDRGNTTLRFPIEERIVGGR